MRFVYLLRAGNEYKVGIANNLRKRISSIQTSNAKKIELVCARRSINAPLLEKTIHDKLKKYGGNGGREWFTLTPTAALDVAVKLNATPEVDTADLIINDLTLDIRNIMLGYWHNLDREMRAGGVLSKPVAYSAATKKEDRSKNGDDPLLEQAIMIVKQKGKASTSLLQREMRVGYARAARIMDNMEKNGIVSELNGIKREVLLN